MPSCSKTRPWPRAAFSVAGRPWFSGHTGILCIRSQAYVPCAVPRALAASRHPQMKSPGNRRGHPTRNLRLTSLVENQNTVPADNAPITGRPATRTPAKPQPAKQTPPAVSKEIPKANPRPQSPGPKAAAWDQGAAGDWGPVESRPDFIGKSYMLKAALAVSGADFALRTCLPA